MKIELDVFSTIPTGLHPSAQGWPCQRTTLGKLTKLFFNPNGVAFSRRRLTEPWAERFESLPGSPRYLGLRWQSAAATPLSDEARRENFQKPSTVKYTNHAKQFSRSRILCVSRFQIRTQSGVALRFPPRSMTPKFFHACPPIAHFQNNAETQSTQSFAKKISSAFLRVLCASAFILIC